MDTATLAIKLTLNGAQEIIHGVKSVGEGFRGMVEVFGAINEHAFFLIENLRNVAETGRRIAEGVNEAFIMPNAEKERYAAQFEFMLGTAEAAAQRLEDLDAFKAKNPFDEESILNASVALQRFGDGSLASGKGLQLVADLAAYTNTGFADMAQTIGFAYQAIASGGDLGRAAMQLQHLGVLSREDADRLGAMSGAGAEIPKVKQAIKDLDLELRRHDVEVENRRAKNKGASDPMAAFDVEATEAKRAKLVDLQNQLASLTATAAGPDQVWEKFTESLEKTKGAAERMRHTYTGTMQALANQWDEFKERTGKGLFDAVEADLVSLEGRIRGVFDDGSVDRWSQKLGGELRKLYGEFKGRSLLGLGFEDISGGLNGGNILNTLGTALKDSMHNAFAEFYNLAIDKGPDIVAALTPQWLRRVHAVSEFAMKNNPLMAYNANALSLAGSLIPPSLHDASYVADRHISLVDVQQDLRERGLGRYSTGAQRGPEFDESAAAGAAWFKSFSRDMQDAAAAAKNLKTSLQQAAEPMFP